ncbi:MAG TPA: glycosyltransferase family 1 protein [bacterium]|nr:glycosyltransferase family 1 protein [bacterium]
MKIGIDASRANLEKRSGIENYSLQIIKTLIGIDKSNEYILYMREAPIRELQDLPPNVTIKVLEDTGWYRLARKYFRLPQFWTHRLLARELRNNPVDVLFVPGHVLPRGYTGKSVVIIHDVAYELVPEVYSFIQRAYLRWSTRQALTRATRVVTVSEKTRQDLVTYYQADADRIQVCYPGYNSGLYRPADTDIIQAARRKYGLDKPYICFVGTIAPKKGLQTLIEAFALFLNEKYNAQLEAALEDALAVPSTGKEKDFSIISPDIHLVLIGKGTPEYVREMKQKAESSLVSDRVHFLGYVEDDELVALLSGALIYVQPSLYEGFGIPVIEAMACGIPVISTDAGALLEVVADAGLVCTAQDSTSLKDALVELISNDKKRNEMKKAGLKRSQAFSWKRTAQDIKTIFEQISGAS